MPKEPISNYISESAMVQVIRDVMIDDAVALLDALPDRSASPLEFGGIMNLSHGEEIEVWTQELASMMGKLQNRKRKPISLLDLICTLEASRTGLERKACLIDLWLAFLLGSHDYRLRRMSHDFYSPVGIEIVVDH